MLTYILVFTIIDLVLTIGVLSAYSDLRDDLDDLMDNKLKSPVDYHNYNFEPELESSNINEPDIPGLF